MHICFLAFSNQCKHKFLSKVTATFLTKISRASAEMRGNIRWTESSPQPGIIFTTQSSQSRKIVGESCTNEINQVQIENLFLEFTHKNRPQKLLIDIDEKLRG